MVFDSPQEGPPFLLNSLFHSHMDEPHPESFISTSIWQEPSTTIITKTYDIDDSPLITAPPELRPRAALAEPQNADCQQAEQSASQAIRQASQLASESIRQATQQASQSADAASRSATEAIRQATQGASQSIAAASRSVSSAISSANSAVSSAQSSASSVVSRALASQSSAQQSAASAQISASSAQVRLLADSSNGEGHLGMYYVTHFADHCHPHR
jgi:hypothetical protein